MTSLRWFAVLQSLISAGLMTVLWVLHTRLGSRSFFRWWALAWTAFAAFVVLGAVTLPLAAEWGPTRGTLVFVATLCGFLQPTLLVFGAMSLQSADRPTRNVQAFGFGSTLLVGALSVGASLLASDPIDSFCVRVAPRALALAAAAVFCVVVLVRCRREIGTAAFAMTGASCLLQAGVQALYALATIGRLWAGDGALLAAMFDGRSMLRSQVFLADIVSAYGVCLGMVLLLVEDFRRSTRALDQSLRAEQKALDANAALQAEIAERRRVESALRFSEDRYRDLIEHSDDLICTHGLDGRILTVNPAPARILGYSPDELTRMTIPELLLPETREEFDGYLAAINRDGAARGLMTVLTRSGERRQWEFRSTLRADGVPAPVVRAMARDVTERVTAERALRLSEAKFAAAFRATPCGIAISTFEDGRVLEINEAAEAQTGYSRDEIIGRTTQELLWIEPAERAAIIAELKALGKVANRQVRWRSKAGKELTILFSADTIKMHDQAFMLSVALDITAHQQVEARHHAILRAIPDWMFLMSNDGVFLDFHVRDKRFLIAPPEALIGRTIADVLAPPLAGELTNLFAQAARSAEPATLEYRMPFDNEVRHFETRAVRCDHDKVLCIVRDVTQAKQTEDEARRLRHELAHIGRVTTLSALTGSLAHEIRQPLAAIRTNAQAAQRLIPQNATLTELRHALTDIVADSQRAVDVMERVSSMLKRDFSTYGDVDLNAGIEEVVSLLRADLLARQISLAVELEEDLPRVLGDRIQLQQVALNLLLNACDAVDDRPEGERRIVVRTATRDSRATVSVTDLGVGLTEEQRDRVFEPFYTTKPHGMGLGLSICEMIVSGHDGTLTVDGHNGLGTTFSFGLPALPREVGAHGSASMRADQIGSRPA